MRERRFTRWQSFWQASVGTAYVVLPSGLSAALIAYLFARSLGLGETDALGLTSVVGASALLAPFVTLTMRDYIRIRDRETLPEREYREKALLRKLAARYPGEVNDL